MKRLWRLQGNPTEELLEDHLTGSEWNEWSAEEHRHGPLGAEFITLPEHIEKFVMSREALSTAVQHNRKKTGIKENV